ncbi:hypothetical protein T4D_13067 [Trichinella pseudospiralis]|uniref:Uncharacterized protein n=1 Tax=Trichinella pseudospiralis TaxID=6337 RepID=A0A0V1FMX7_TRIPS|nr:hypothetical protein T4D_13067 [Trichinella pseudospiralis]
MKNAFATALGNCSFLVLCFNRYVANGRQKMRQTTSVGWKIFTTPRLLPINVHPVSKLGSALFSTSTFSISHGNLSHIHVISIKSCAYQYNMSTIYIRFVYNSQCQYKRSTVRYTRGPEAKRLNHNKQSEAYFADNSRRFIKSGLHMSQAIKLSFAFTNKLVFAKLSRIISHTAVQNRRQGRNRTD